MQRVNDAPLLQVSDARQPTGLTAPTANQQQHPLVVALAACRRRSSRGRCANAGTDNWTVADAIVGSQTAPTTQRVVHSEHYQSRYRRRAGPSRDGAPDLRYFARGMRCEPGRRR